ncbi:MAG: hypothetical protein IBX40_04790 [Methanosarcinales archaeon]|nr:hypothetical protein [Methanosarcinales archaeon]
MLTLEELSGIVEVMVVLSEDEIFEIAQELAYMRDEEIPDLDEIRQLIKSALGAHWLESIFSTAVCDAPGGEKHYIAGPASFGNIPPEFSEIMEIFEFDGCRSFDWDMVASDIVETMSRKVSKLESLFEDVEDGYVVIEKAENEYSDLINLYYDYNFWLPDGLPGIGISLENISQRLSEFKEKEGE